MVINYNKSKIQVLIKLILFALLLTSGIELKGQTVYALEGRLFNLKDSSFVQASNVYTLPGNKGNMSDPNGYFYMEITNEDTLYVSTIGYKTYRILCKDLIENNDLRIHIFLEPKMYELAELNVLGTMSYEEFKEELMQLPLAEIQEPDFDIPWEWYGYLDMPQNAGFGVTFSGIFSGLYDKYSREGKQKRKIQELEQRADMNDYIFSKFNPYVIQRATGIIDENEIVQFMEFCQFSDYFIVNATDAEMQQALAQKYELFKNNKSAN